MKSKSYQPHNYRAFSFNKYVRNGPLERALREGGYVFATRPQGRSAAIGICNKFLEEIAEVKAATTHDELLEELADVAAFAKYVFDFYSAPMPKNTDMTLIEVEDLWRDKLKTAQSMSYHDTDFLNNLAFEASTAALAAFTYATVINHLGSSPLYNRREGAAEIDDLEAAMLTKSANKGAFKGWFANVIMLPRDHTFNITLEAKGFIEMDASMFAPTNSITLDAIARASG